jgi:hypothetical protein
VLGLVAVDADDRRAADGVEDAVVDHGGALECRAGIARGAAGAGPVLPSPIVLRVMSG